MKADTPLDYAEFQLTTARNRCELFVSAEGETEKLASGFLKPFVAHLRAAEEQIARGCQAIRLERQPSFKEQDSSWFTKGTLERFVRFVSTPEVLERVKTIEDELVQLEQVRKIQATSLAQTEGCFSGLDTVVLTADGKLVTGMPRERIGAPIMSRRYPMNLVDNGAEASKRELLRAMDVRLLALEQEQNMAFARASAAGFDMVNVADLISFAEHFGADRLREACTQFNALSRKRQGVERDPEQMDSPTGEAVSSSSDMSLASGTGGDVGETEVISDVKHRNSFDDSFCIPKGNWDSEGGEICSNGVFRSTERTGFARINSHVTGGSRVDMRKRWGPPESFKADFLHLRAPSSQDGLRTRIAPEIMEETLHCAHPHQQRLRGSSEDGAETEKLQDLVGSNSVVTSQLCCEEKGTFTECTQSKFSEKAASVFEDVEQGVHIQGQLDSESSIEGIMSQSAGQTFHRVKHQDQQYDSVPLSDRVSSVNRGAKGEKTDIPGNKNGSNSSREMAVQGRNSFVGGKCVVKDEQRSSESGSKDCMFYCRLQQMAQQIEARRTDSVHSISSGCSVSDDMQVEIDLTEPSSSSNWQESAFSSHDGSSPASRVASADSVHSSSQRDDRSQVDANKAMLQKLSSPKRRSTSPLRRVQIGRTGLRRSSSVVVRSINHVFSQERSDMEKNSTNGSENSDIEDGVNNCNSESSGPARRLSVQDAISLFESKRRDSNEAPIRRLVKQESQKFFVENGNSSSSGKTVLRRWSIGNDLSSGAGSLQEEFMKTESQGAASKAQADLKHIHGDNIQFSTNGLTEATNESRDQPLANQKGTKGQKGFSGSNSSHNSSEYWQHSHSDSAAGLATFEEEFSDTQITSEQHNIASHKMHEEEKQTQFKMELAKSLSREASNSSLSRNVPSRSELSPTEADLLCEKKLTKSDSYNLMDEVAARVIHTSKNWNTSLELQEKINISRDSKTIAQSTPDFSILTAVHITTQEHENTGWENVNQSEIEISGFKESGSDAIPSSDTVDKSSFSVKLGEIMGRESLGSSLNTPPDFNMQALVNMAGHQHSELAGYANDESPKEEKGRFYEQYIKLRDAKLRNEQASKRAEREAKLKAMEETLERRKAEMEEKTARSSKRTNPLMQAHLCAEKLHPLNIGILMEKRGQEKEEDMERGADQEYIVQATEQANISSSTPRALKDQIPTSKLAAASKKTAQNSQKSLSTPRNTTRALISSSPRSATRDSTGMPNQRRSAVSNQAGPIDNPLTRSVPCFADLRKENTKPPGRMAVSARPYPKTNSHLGRQQTISEAAPLEVRPASGKEERKQRSMQTRKSFAMVSQLKALSVQVQEVAVLAPPRVQKEQKGEPPICSKLRRSVVAPTLEVKPFLRKGHGIGPGAGPGVVKLKASTADASKSSDEETPANSTVDAEVNGPKGHEEGEAWETGDLESPSIVDDSESGLGIEAISTLNLTMATAPNSQSLRPSDNQPEKSGIITLDGLPDDTSDNDRTCHTISFPIDPQTQKRHAYFFTNQGSNGEPTFLDRSRCNDEQGPILTPLSQLLFRDINASGKGTFSNQFSPPSAVSIDSPIGSPASWSSSQIQYASEADLARSRRKWSAAQKPIFVISQPPKEPAKGLKRLLKFGRKSRTSETATTDWISASTTSEGDDDAEEPRDIGNQSYDDLLRPTRMHERSIDFVNAVGFGDHNNEVQGTTQSVRSSIPAPPANFKLREDRISGDTLLKAPRSFFSLSSFRSRASEGKSR